MPWSEIDENEFLEDIEQLKSNYKSQNEQLNKKLDEIADYVVTNRYELSGDTVAAEGVRLKIIKELCSIDETNFNLLKGKVKVNDREKTIELMSVLIDKVKPSGKYGDLYAELSKFMLTHNSKRSKEKRESIISGMETQMNQSIERGISITSEVFDQLQHNVILSELKKMLQESQDKVKKDKINQMIRTLYYDLTSSLVLDNIPLNSQEVGSDWVRFLAGGGEIKLNDSILNLQELGFDQSVHLERELVWNSFKERLNNFFDPLLAGNNSPQIIEKILSNLKGVELFDCSGLNAKYFININLIGKFKYNFRNNEDGSIEIEAKSSDLSFGRFNEKPENLKPGNIVILCNLSLNDNNEVVLTKKIVLRSNEPSASSLLKHKH